MKRIFMIFICTALLFCGCAENQGTAEVSPTASLPDVTATPTPTLPSDKGPSAVFTATPGPIATPTPTPFIIPTPTPVPTPDYQSKESQEKMIKMLSGYKFDYVTDVKERNREEFENDEEYIEYIQNECERLYEENLEYLRTNEIDTLYIRINFVHSDYIQDSPYVCLKITDKRTIRNWVNFTMNTRMVKNSEYSFKGYLPVLCGGTPYTLLEFCVEKNGEITKMFGYNGHYTYGVSYFEKEPHGRLPLATEKEDYIIFKYEIEISKYLDKSLLENYDTGEEVKLVFDKVGY